MFSRHTLLPWNLSANFTRALMSRPALRYMNNCLFWLAYDHRFEESIHHLMRNQKAHHSTQWGDLYSSVPISKIDSSEGESTIPQTPRRRLPLRAWHRAVSPSLHSHPISLGDPRSWDDIRNRHDWMTCSRCVCLQVDGFWEFLYLFRYICVHIYARILNLRTMYVKTG